MNGAQQAAHPTSDDLQGVHLCCAPCGVSGRGCVTGCAPWQASCQSPKTHALVPFWRFCRRDHRKALTWTYTAERYGIRPFCLPRFSRIAAGSNHATRVLQCSGPRDQLPATHLICVGHQTLQETEAQQPYMQASRTQCREHLQRLLTALDTIPAMPEPVQTISFSDALHGIDQCLLQGFRGTRACATDLVFNF